MKGRRQEKELNKRELLARNTQLETQNLMLSMDIEQRTKSFLVQQDIAYAIVDAILRDSGTIREARNWWDEWKKDVEQVRLDDDNHNNLMQQMLDKHKLEVCVNESQERAAATIHNIWSKGK